MRSVLALSVFACACVVALCTPTLAVTVPTIETFNNGSANWRDVSSVLLSMAPNGGPDGSAYATTNFAFSLSSSGNPPLFRAQDEFGSSGGAFEGNWQAAGVKKITADVRHNHPSLDLTFFVRFSTPNNSPGVSILSSAPVPAGSEWTTLDFDIEFGNPLMTVGAANNLYENYLTALTNVGHLQVGIVRPSGFAGNPTLFTVGLDNVAIRIPEPSSLVLGFVAIIGGLVIPRRRIR